MADDVKITGLEGVLAVLRGLPDKLRRRALRNALAAGGRVVRDAARREAPVLSASHPAVIRGHRAPGTMRRAIVVRTSKLARRAGNVGVYVNVRPAKGARRGARSKADPYYWRWVEFGAKHMDAKPFLRPAAKALQAAFDAFTRALRPQIDKINRSTGGGV